MKNKNKKIIVSILLLAAITPVFTFAAFTNFDNFLLKLTSSWLPIIGQIMFSLATIIFLWGIVKFIWQDNKEEGKSNIIWGLIGIFIMFSIWGIVSFMQKSTVGKINTINGGNPVYIP